MWGSDKSDKEFGDPSTRALTVKVTTPEMDTLTSNSSRVNNSYLPSESTPNMPTNPQNRGFEGDQWTDGTPRFAGLWEDGVKLTPRPPPSPKVIPDYADPTVGNSQELAGPVRAGNLPGSDRTGSSQEPTDGNSVSPSRDGNRLGSACGTTSNAGRGSGPPPSSAGPTKGSREEESPPMKRRVTNSNYNLRPRPWVGQGCKILDGEDKKEQTGEGSCSHAKKNLLAEMIQVEQPIPGTSHQLQMAMERFTQPAGLRLFGDMKTALREELSVAMVRAEEMLESRNVADQNVAGSVRPGNIDALGRAGSFRDPTVGSIEVQSRAGSFRDPTVGSIEVQGRAGSFRDPTVGSIEVPGRAGSFRNPAVGNLQSYRAVGNIRDSTATGNFPVAVGNSQELAGPVRAGNMPGSDRTGSLQEPADGDFQASSRAGNFSAAVGNIQSYRAVGNIRDSTATGNFSAAVGNSQELAGPVRAGNRPGSDRTGSLQEPADGNFQASSRAGNFTGPELSSIERGVYLTTANPQQEAQRVRPGMRNGISRPVTYIPGLAGLVTHGMQPGSPGAVELARGRAREALLALTSDWPNGPDLEVELPGTQEELLASQHGPDEELNPRDSASQVAGRVAAIEERLRVLGEEDPKETSIDRVSQWLGGQRPGEGLEQGAGDHEGKRPGIMEYHSGGIHGAEQTALKGQMAQGVDAAPMNNPRNGAPSVVASSVKNWSDSELGEIVTKSIQTALVLDRQQRGEACNVANRGTVPVLCPQVLPPSYSNLPQYQMANETRISPMIQNERPSQAREQSVQPREPAPVISGSLAPAQYLLPTPSQNMVVSSGSAPALMAGAAAQPPVAPFLGTGMTPRVEQVAAPAVLQEVLRVPVESGQGDAVVNKPRKLHGYSASDQKWESYKTHLDIVSKLNGWSPATTLNSFCAELSGPALEFYGTLDISERDDPERVMLAMAQRFGTMVNLEAVRSRLDARKQGPNESIEELAADLRNMAYTVYASDTQQRRDKEAIRALRRALNNQAIIQALITANPPAETMSQAVQLAVRARELFAAYLNKAGNHRQVRMNQEDGLYGEDEDWEPAEAEEPFLRAAFQGMGRGMGRSRTFPGNGNMGRGRGVGPQAGQPCWFCSKEDHWARDCQFRPCNWPDWFKTQVSAIAQGQAPPSQFQPAQVPGSAGLPASNGNKTGPKRKGKNSAKPKGAQVEGSPTVPPQSPGEGNQAQHNQGN